jgi:hypothetical protein
VNTGGIHGQDGDASHLDEFLLGCLDAGFPVGLVKVLDQIGMAKRAKEISPATFTVFRKPVQYTSGDDQDNPPLDQDLTQAQIEYIANRWMTRSYPVWRSPIDYLNPTSPKVYEFIDAFEITNEPNPQNERDIRNYNAFYLACMAHAEAQPEHFRLALWSFSAGCPEPYHLEWMRSSLDYACQHGHILAVHEGGVEDDKPHFHDNWNGNPAQGCALRYRMFKEHFGWSPRVAITEAYQIEGYHSPDWADWQWYLTELRRDDYVLGCAWFTLGNYYFSPGQNVNINPVLSGFVAPCVAAAQAQIDPPPNPQPLFLAAQYFSGNAGAACLAMALVYDSIDADPEAVLASIGKTPADWLTLDDLETAAQTYGKTLQPYRVQQTEENLRELTREDKPVITPVMAQYLNKLYPYNGQSYVLVVGYLSDGSILAHDPLGYPYTYQPNWEQAWGCLALVLSDYTPPPPPPPPPPVTATMSGVGTAETRPLTPQEIEALQLSRVSAVKLLTVQDGSEANQLINQVRAVKPDMFILARLMFPPNPESPFSPLDFVNYCGNPALYFYNRGVRHFEIHNEPNLFSEGWGWNWNNGQEFGLWFGEVCTLLRLMMPGASFGFPGLSPQADTIGGVCIASDLFLQQAASAVIQAAWLGAHSYWQARGTGHWQMSSEDYGGWYYRRAQRAFPAMPLYITEYSCNNQNVSDAEKGCMYKDYLRDLPGVNAAFAFCLAWNSDMNNEGFVRDDIVTDIPRMLGA